MNRLKRHLSASQQKDGHEIIREQQAISTPISREVVLRVEDDEALAICAMMRDEEIEPDARQLACDKLRGRAAFGMLYLPG